MKKITIFGSTGSVGLSALDIIRQKPDEFRISTLVANTNAQTVLEQALEFKPDTVCLYSESAAESIRAELPSGIKLISGDKGLMDAAMESKHDMILAASSGSASLLPVLSALEAGCDVAVANKEILVMAGALFMQAAKKSGGLLLPVDSEHNAIFQCLEACKDVKAIRRIILTGSGGPLKDVPLQRFGDLTQDKVLNHPKWSMGPKITVDSATMMNKGLEIIEARWLFGVAVEQIEVLIHPEAIIHSMVEFIDGSIMAQMGPTDMKLPILHALGYPRHIDYPDLKTDFVKLAQLNFEKPKQEKFPCLRMAFEVAEAIDTTAPCVLNATDEIVVDAYLRDLISFTDIPIIIENVLTKHEQKKVNSLEDILNADQWARDSARRECQRAIKI
ncbi:MAG: 1-deoxy-D-xylulose-5-phosphate reductoisomerase [Candidatus Omnitrophota bacterium]|jgi:1-deoxy-D-xylulose-5-phosphate reductoisomerase